jgi:alginate O-acetyltransferase complex protein AlgI
MLFNSYSFIFLFLPTALLGFFLLARINRTSAATWLAFASLVFYGYWSVKYVPLLLCSVAFNFGAGKLISVRAQSRSGKALLTGAVSANLLLLGFYKYADFFLGAINDLTDSHLSLLRIALPIGISFFTFTQIAFLVDTYRRKAREYRFAHYLLFATYFPHLIAGPILHHSEVMPQFELRATYRPTLRAFCVGLTVFAIGLAKKVLLADNLALIVDPIFAAAHAGTPIRLVWAWCALLAYAWQLYFDFSGYSDMAIGISKLFGIDLPINFNSPYKAASIIEFWQRWHMTLSRFLRDYLYFPLGGNRRGTLRRYVNLLLTMILGGLWHGANYTYIVWGALHGGYLIIAHAWRHFAGARGRSVSPLGRLAAGSLTFLAVTVAWAFFRAEDVPTALDILRGVCGLNGLARHQSFAVHLSPGAVIGYLATASVIGWAFRNTSQLMVKLEQLLALGIDGHLQRRAIATAAGGLLAAALLAMHRISPFLYFQF